MVGGSRSKASNCYQVQPTNHQQEKKNKSKTRLWQQHTVLDASLATAQQSSHKRQQ